MSREALSFPAYMPFLLFSKEGIRVKLAFTKMHGCGNNYIYFNCFDQTVPDPESLSIKLSEPHFGIGGDGIILISPSDKADAQMRIFNADGSEGKNVRQRHPLRGQVPVRQRHDRWPHHHHH